MAVSPAGLGVRQVVIKSLDVKILLGLCAALRWRSAASNLRVPAPGLSALEMSTSHPLPDRRTPYVGCDVMLGVRREDQGRKGDKGGSCAWEVRATATAPGLRPACG